MITIHKVGRILRDGWGTYIIEDFEMTYEGVDTLHNDLYDLVDRYYPNLLWYPLTGGAHKAKRIGR